MDPTAPVVSIRAKNYFNKISLSKLYTIYKPLIFLAIDCRWDRWSAWGQCKQVCPDGSRTRTRAKSQLAQHGGRECDGDSEELTSCNRLSELENELAQLREETRLLEEQLGCDVTRCKATPYRKCSDSPLCGTKNGISCSYIPQGLGNTGCAEDPLPTLTGGMGKADL